MKKNYLLILFLAAAGAVTAQPDTARQQPHPGLSARLSPLGLIDPFDERITMGMEWKIKPRFSIGVDGSYIFNSVYYDSHRSVRGWMVSPYLRWYRKMPGYFFEWRGFYKQVDYDIHDWLEKEAVNGVGAYEEINDFTMRKQVAGVNFIAGQGKAIYPGSRLYFEWYVGLGLRGKWSGVRGDPHAVYTITGNSFYNTAFTIWPSAPMGITFGYSFP